MLKKLLSYVLGSAVSAETLQKKKENILHAFQSTLDQLTALRTEQVQHLEKIENEISVLKQESEATAKVLISTDKTIDKIKSILD